MRNHRIREEWRLELNKLIECEYCFTDWEKIKSFIDELLKSQELNYKINCSKHGHITPKPVCPKCYNKTLAELDVLIYDKSKRK